MKISIPENLDGKELYKFLVENKAQLISQKKMLYKKCDPVFASPSYFVKEGQTSKAAAVSDIPDNATSVLVKVVGNTSMFCDSMYDVLLPDCWKKSIKERQGLVPHLHDHIHEIGAEVGDVKKFYSQDINLVDLGWDATGFTQCLIFETNVQKDYNPVVFNKYKTGKIRQHSISLQYKKIGMAINDEEYVVEYDLWNKYYEDIINKEVVDESGFFWVVPEIMVIENSAVLFGSNSLTPTLSAKGSTHAQPSMNTEKEPQKTMVGCQTCNKFFYSYDGENKCPDCGQFQSLSNNSIVVPFDLMKAIEETTFINY